MTINLPPDPPYLADAESTPLRRVGRFIRIIDRSLRWFDFHVNLTYGGALARFAISRHMLAAVCLPAAIVFFFVNGPSLRVSPRLGIAAIAMLVQLDGPAWLTPLLKFFFVISYVVLAFLVGINVILGQAESRRIPYSELKRRIDAASSADGPTPGQSAMALPPAPAMRLLDARREFSEGGRARIVIRAFDLCQLGEPGPPAST